MSTKKLIAICAVLLTAIIGTIAFKVYSDYAADRKAEIAYQQQQLEESKSDKQSSVKESQRQEKYAESQAEDMKNYVSSAIEDGKAQQASYAAEESSIYEQGKKDIADDQARMDAQYGYTQTTVAP